MHTSEYVKPVCLAPQRKNVLKSRHNSTTVRYSSTGVYSVFSFQNCWDIEPTIEIDLIR